MGKKFILQEGKYEIEIIKRMEIMLLLLISG